jgi:putative phosphoribosyl transferase
MTAWGLAMMIFAHRAGAGRRLADSLSEYDGRNDVIVLGLTRGGVPVAAEIARALHAPLDVLVVHKLGMPGQEELAFGAIAPGEMVVVDDRWAKRIPPAAVQFVVARERIELVRTERRLRGTRPPVDVCNKVTILVDDGMATGATMRAAIRSVRRSNPKEVVVAVPIAGRDALDIVGREADKVVCLAQPDDFTAVSLWYIDFPRINDEEVEDLLAHPEAGAHHVLA